MRQNYILLRWLRLNLMQTQSCKVCQISTTEGKGKFINLRNRSFGSLDNRNRSASRDAQALGDMIGAVAAGRMQLQYKHTQLTQILQVPCAVVVESF